MTYFDQPKFHSKAIPELRTKAIIYVRFNSWTPPLTITALPKIATQDVM
jgi:hypothetical protein